jgi:dTDP-glucose 4,6-dehydratase
MKRILVTGANGFIGAHFVSEVMKRTDWHVVSLDRLDVSGTYSRLGEIFDENPEWRTRFTPVWHDLKAALNEFVDHRIGHVDYVVHLAAGSHVDRSIDYPMEFVMDNVVGTANLLDWFRTRQTTKKILTPRWMKNHLEVQKTIKAQPRFLYFSTDEVFGPAPEGVAYKEWDRYNSGNPYSAAKAGAEELCVAYANTYKLDIMVTHTMNVFGERQHPEKFIPKIIRKVRDNELVTIHSNSDRTKAGSRHYIHARDVADAVLLLLEKGRGLPLDKYNIVGEREMDNLELAQMIAKIMNKNLSYQLTDFHSSRPGHDLRYALDGTKMKEEFNWEPRLKVNERLVEVVEWTLAHEENWLFTPKNER